MSYHTDKLMIDGRRHSRTRTRTQATTIPGGQNWPEVIEMRLLMLAIAWNIWLSQTLISNSSTQEVSGKTWLVSIWVAGIYYITWLKVQLVPAVRACEYFNCMIKAIEMKPTYWGHKPCPPLSAVYGHEGFLFRLLHSHQNSLCAHETDQRQWSDLHDRDTHDDNHAFDRAIDHDCVL